MRFISEKMLKVKRVFLLWWKGDYVPHKNEPYSGFFIPDVLPDLYTQGWRRISVGAKLQS